LVENDRRSLGVTALIRLEKETRLFSDHWLISDHHLVFKLTTHFSSPAMSAENREAHSSSRALPFREGALGPAEIRRECPQFRILVIGKANAGKTTILRKVCNAEPDAKPIIYNANGNKVDRDLASVCHANFAALGQTNITLDSYRSCFGCLRFLDI
jgi:hypothetical protein